MPFRPTNASPSFQHILYIVRAASSISRGKVSKLIEWYYRFLKDLSENMKGVANILATFDRADFQIKRRKYRNFAQNYEYMEWIWEPEEVRIDPKKMSAMAEATSPKAMSQPRSFSDTANFFRQLAGGCAKIASSFTSNLRKWTPDKRSFLVLCEHYRHSKSISREND